MKNVLCLFLILFSSSLIVFPSDIVWPDSLDTAKNVSYLTEEEKNVILEMNKVRTNPKAYAEYLRQERTLFDGDIVRKPGEIPLKTSEGVVALDECLVFLENMEPMGCLYPDRNLSRAAEQHAGDQSKTGDTGHLGSDKSMFDKRIKKYSKAPYIRVAENISYGFGTGYSVVLRLMIDDGVKDRGHRDNIMTSGFDLCGVSIKPHPVYRYICVITYMQSGNPD